MYLIGNSGHVRRSVLAVPSPAAGAGAAITVPGSELWVVLAVAFRIVTSAAVATRTPVLEFTDGSGEAITWACAGYGTTASSTVDYCFAYGLSEWDAAGTSTASGPCPLVPLGAGDDIALSVNAIDTGDQLSRIRVTLAQQPIRPDAD